MKSIYINEVGFLTESAKKAVLNFKADSFSICDKNGKSVFEGNVTHFGKDDISGEDTYVADFKSFKEEGTYYIYAGDVKSPTFEIGKKTYDKLMKDLCKCFYYLRCGTGLSEEFAGAYAHKPCHTKLAKIFGDEKTEVDVCGGWHDAGDYGRYTTAGATAVAHLLCAVRLFPALKNVKFDIPEEKKLPDILAEVKVELDFLMKMQREDGAAWHKVTTMRHADFIMPEEDINDLYLFPVSSIATADLSAVCALAYTIYKEYDNEYAEKLMAVSKKAYEWLSENPEELLFHNPKESNTGEYDEAEDISNRFWAAAALYEATGEENFYREALFQKERLVAFENSLEKKYLVCNMFTSLGWAEVAGLGVISLILANKDNSLTAFAKENVLKEADRLLEVSKQNGFGLCMTARDFIWGSNMELGKYLMILVLAKYMTKDEKYSEAITAGIDYLLGCNSMVVSYVTGNGEHAFMNPHLRPTAVDGVEAPWPGLVSGGPNRGLQDEKAQDVPKDSAPMKCYLDDVACYSLNEITIYWNSPFVFVLASLI